jgi:hypothetical protein
MIAKRINRRSGDRFGRLARYLAIRVKNWTGFGLQVATQGPMVKTLMSKIWRSPLPR